MTVLCVGDRTRFGEGTSAALVVTRGGEFRCCTWYRSIVICLVFFFFSSRRRHTRCLSDWSSDVCSSDLSLPLRSPPRSARSSASHRQRSSPATRVFVRA